MTPTPRDVLIEIIAKHGEPLLASPLRTEGLLKDYCGEFRREIFVLVSCLRVGVVEQIRRQGGPSVKLVCARLALKLEQNLAISGDVAKWAVESWAIALGLLLPENATARLSDIFDLSARTLRQDPPSLPLLDSPDAKPTLGLTAQSTLRVKMRPEDGGGPIIETPVEEAEPPIEFQSLEPESSWPVPDWSKPASTVTIHPDSTGVRPTFREALRLAVPNTCLILKPGVYHESLVVKKDLQVRAEGGLGTVVIESATSSVAMVDGACLFLAGLTLRGIGGKDKKTQPAVEVKSGHLVMEDCDLTSDISTVVEVKGERSELIARRCHMHDSKAGGILFQDKAVGYLGECHLYGNKLSQVVIGTGCSPTIFSCHISHALMAGIYVNEGGEGFIENCDIWGNAVGGVQCRRGGRPHFRHCRISANQRYGVLVAGQSDGFFEHCQIFDNAEFGVTISEQSRPRFSGCKIFDNHAAGVEIAGQSECELLDCELFNNEGPNVLVKEKSPPKLYRCVIHDGRQEGVRITSGSEGRYEQCEFYANVLAGIAVLENSKPVFQHCVLHHGIENGISALHGAEGQFVDCEITHHAGTAVLVGSKSQPRFERCHIVDNQKVGVHVDDASLPAFSECVIKLNGGIGFYCTLASAPKMSAGEISENGGGGLVVASQGKGRWEEVHFIANKLDTVLVSEGARPTLRACRIEEAAGAGLRFMNSSLGVVENIEITDSAGPGVEIEGGANPSLKQVHILRGKGFGLVVQPGGGGTADHCEIQDNAGGDWSVADSARLVRVGC